MRTSWAGACLIGAAATLAACSSSGSTKSQASTAVPTTAITTAPGPSTTAAASGPEAMAKAAVVQAADLPADWKPQAQADEPDHDKTWRDLVGCLGLDPAQGQVASASSPTYVTGIATQVSSTVAYLDTDARVGALAAAFSGDKFAACVQKAYGDDVGRNAPPGATASDVQVAVLDFPHLGQTTSAYRATATITVGPGVKVPITNDFITVFNGKAVSRLAFLNNGAPFPSDLQRSLVQKVVART